MFALALGALFLDAREGADGLRTHQAYVGTMFEVNV
jgi:hypothetical protein